MALMRLVKVPLSILLNRCYLAFKIKKQAVHGQYRPRTSKAYGGELRFSEAGHNYKLVRTDGPKGGDVKLFDVDHDTELPANTFWK